MEKTDFITQPKGIEGPWAVYDFLFPGGKVAKLCKVNNISSKDLKVSEITNRLKLVDPVPVVILAGAKQTEQIEARACFKTDAVVIDSGIGVGIETFVTRRNLKLMGVAPEEMVSYPKINPSYVDPFQLKNNENKMSWGDEVQFKFSLANSLAQGKMSKKAPKCKIIMLLFAQNEGYMNEIELAVQQDIPIIVIPGSKLCDKIIQYLQIESEEEKNNANLPPDLLELLEQGHFYALNSHNSEEIASYVHFFLTVYPYELNANKKLEKKENNIQPKCNLNSNLILDLNDYKSNANTNRSNNN